ncbi:hypothetical protein A2154_01415 [Candidatus Gottesmanbacteria bacterium RBG_16_43_7]|uniref:Glucose/Sorbosone dehydrogenase domain-containing protein n=1 Tax=Candidatus Gottesmanbacteria bacterium RBG_16_43_7 TaxID=1798373 RepID=A0A1F5ZAR1_9BACT|nr:MAG: hypothetical protein A2154_01415 [Candidatus Gottesmanbacteria bacterium RBG_16_43_7]
MKRVFVGVALGVLLVIYVVYRYRSNVVLQSFRPSPTQLSNIAPTTIDITELEIILTGLYVPWEIVFLPDNTILVTERSGNLVVYKDGDVRRIRIENATQVGEGGLLGMTIDPQFQDNRFLYLYYTYRDYDQIRNRVVRYEYQDTKIDNARILVDRIPGAANHNGGRIAFGPDGYLYITTGDAQRSNLVQNTDSLAGKILRIGKDGSIPTDNPFGNAVYSYGHRNPQGLAWDELGNLWATEHGRSGIQSGLDEVNKIEIGKNYGWPEIEGDEIMPGMITPALNSGPAETWAPAGIIYQNNALYFTGLRGSSLYRIPLSGGTVTGAPDVLYTGNYGRLRALVIGPDGHKYMTSSNTDGRGTVHRGDDKLIKLP